MNVKEACAKRAFDMIEEGMTVGLGGGKAGIVISDDGNYIQEDKCKKAGRGRK